MLREALLFAVHIVLHLGPHGRALQLRYDGNELTRRPAGEEELEAREIAGPDREPGRFDRRLRRLVVDGRQPGIRSGRVSLRVGLRIVVGLAHGQLAVLPSSSSARIS